MDKWEYIHRISKRGALRGGDSGVLELLKWCGKLNTMQVTEEEARLFFEDPFAPPPEADPEQGAR